MKKRFLTNPWTIALVSTVAGPFLVSAIVALAARIRFDSVLLAIWRFILSLLRFRIPAWVVIIIGLLAWLIFYVTIKIKEAIKDAVRDSLAWLQYTSDFVDSWFLAWEWIKQFKGGFEIYGIHPECPNCKCNMLSISLEPFLRCPNCGRRNHEFTIDDKRRAEQIILSRVRTSEYKKRMQPTGREQ